MVMRRMWTLAALAVAFLGGFAARGALPGVPVVEAQSGRVFELRTYTANDGKLDALHERFRQHTTKLFAKHGMTNVGYFKAMDAPLSSNTMVYILSYPSREDAKKSWAEFGQDPEWKKVVAESEANGKLIMKAENVFLEPADYSPMK
jgi:hypothetical protein